MNEILSPIMFWKGFDAKSIPLATTIVKESESDGLIFREVYFNGMMQNDGKARIYGVFVFAKGAKKLPAILYLGEEDSSPNLDVAVSLAKEGYAVFAVDFCGSSDNRARFTIYPSSLDYANYENARPFLFSVGEDAQHSCWYAWTCVARRALTQLESFTEADLSNIAALGTGLGCDIVYKLAAIDERIKAAAVGHSKNWQGRKSPYCKSEADIAVETSQWTGLISAQSYVQHIKIPFYIYCATNEATGSFDNNYICYSRLPMAEGQFISVTERQDRETGYAQRNNLKSFFRAYLKKEFSFVARPELSCSERDGMIWLKMKCDSERKIESAQIFYSYGCENPSTRNWFSLRLEEVDGEFVARAPVCCVDTYFVAYGNVNYENISISSRLIARTPAQMGIKAPNVRQTRLIYDGGGKDCFFALNSNADFTKSEAIEYCEGALGICGVKATMGELATFKLGDAGYVGFSDASLVLSVFASENTTAHFSVYSIEKGSLKQYSVAYELEGQDAWQRVSFERKDFKTECGTSPNEWKDVILFSLSSDKTIMISSMLWA